MYFRSCLSDRVDQSLADTRPRIATLFASFLTQKKTEATLFQDILCFFLLKSIYVSRAIVLLFEREKSTFQISSIHSLHQRIFKVGGLPRTSRFRCMGSRCRRNGFLARWCINVKFIPNSRIQVARRTVVPLPPLDQFFFQKSLASSDFRQFPLQIQRLRSTISALLIHQKNVSIRDSSFADFLCHTEEIDENSSVRCKKKKERVYMQKGCRKKKMSVKGCIGGFFSFWVLL